jgi:Ribbon-helix-helix protein, copG family
VLAPTLQAPEQFAEFLERVVADWVSALSEAQGPGIDAATGPRTQPRASSSLAEIVDICYHTYMVRTTVYLPENTKQRLTEAARRQGLSEAEFIRSAIEHRVSEVLPRKRGRWGTIRFDEPGLARKVDAVLAEGFGQE